MARPSVCRLISVASNLCIATRKRTLRTTARGRKRSSTLLPKADLADQVGPGRTMNPTFEVSSTSTRSQQLKDQRHDGAPRKRSRFFAPMTDAVPAPAAALTPAGFPPLYRDAPCAALMCRPLRPVRKARPCLQPQRGLSVGPSDRLVADSRGCSPPSPGATVQFCGVPSSALGVGSLVTIYM
jgi:hypothetical protein